MNKKTESETAAANKNDVPSETAPAMAFPFFQKELSHLQKEMDRMFNSMWKTGQSSLQEFTGVLWPDVDESEDDKAYHVTMEMPGLDEKDVEVTFADGILTIKGEKSEESERKEKTFYRKERSFGSFQRSFTLPGPVNEAAIEASMDKGLLTVLLPKAPDHETRKRKIAVKKA